MNNNKVRKAKAKKGRAPDSRLAEVPAPSGDEWPALGLDGMLQPNLASDQQNGFDVSSNGMQHADNSSVSLSRSLHREQLNGQKTQIDAVATASNSLPEHAGVPERSGDASSAVSLQPP